MFIHYVGGEGRNKKLVAIGFGLSTDPKAYVAALHGTMPFNLRLLACEKGDDAKLEKLRATFKGAHLNGPWYKPTPELQVHIDSVEAVDLEASKDAPGKMTRVSLDLNADEFAALEQLVGEMGAKSKAQLLRQALRFYGNLYRYKAQGYGIQAVRGGKLIQFPDLDIR
jgi:hypothetical protein